MAMTSAEAAACWEANAETWTRHARAGLDVYRDVVNTPAFLAMLPAVDGLAGLDLGCGEGGNTRQLARLGARVAALDMSATFLRHAHEAEHTERLGIAYVRADAARLPFAGEAFDFVTAFMSLMDMPDQNTVLLEINRVLRRGGFLQFSILHPCFVPPHRRVLREADGITVRAVEVGDYFSNIDGRVDRWWFGTLSAEERARVPAFQEPRFHRTLSTWMNLLVATGFVIECLGEPCADAATAAAVPHVADTRVAPLFLHVRARKPALAPAAAAP
ncbi:class I SAM-dependent methyltransferase [Rhodopila sp.]|uniref:class I SAM-dependent methyltransferase n=1 Tax=Rhodopila sp. TaxID=2480087 RepID=UPI002B9D087A|nr:class I SAM-dependent methyltransferase [Rhodopila sp.]HVZ09935.1 class I SAM-dependent methyltransferase [Rhodopila sp.]